METVPLPLHSRTTCATRTWTCHSCPHVETTAVYCAHRRERDDATEAVLRKTARMVARHWLRDRGEDVHGMLGRPDQPAVTARPAPRTPGYRLPEVCRFRELFESEAMGSRKRQRISHVIPARCRTRRPTCPSHARGRRCEALPDRWRQRLQLAGKTVRHLNEREIRSQLSRQSPSQRRMACRRTAGTRPSLSLPSTERRFQHRAADVERSDKSAWSHCRNDDGDSVGGWSCGISGWTGCCASSRPCASIAQFATVRQEWATTAGAEPASLLAAKRKSRRAGGRRLATNALVGHRHDGIAQIARRT